jgi:Protein of unknown function (DUF2510)
VVDPVITLISDGPFSANCPGMRCGERRFSTIVTFQDKHENPAKVMTQHTAVVETPGWFADPANTVNERFWTGSRWTAMTRPKNDFYAVAVPGVRRAFFDHAIHGPRFRTRRLVVTDDRVRWGQYDMGFREMRSVAFWQESDSSTSKWTKLVFSAESRLGTLRITLKNMRDEEERIRAYNGYKALVSAAESIILPRLAVAYLERLTLGEVIKIGEYQLTSRGVSLHQREGRRQEISGRWSSLQLESRSPSAGQALLRTEAGLAFPDIDAKEKGAAVLPLLLCLAREQFGETNIDDLRDAHLRSSIMDLRQYAGPALSYAL